MVDAWVLKRLTCLTPLTSWLGSGSPPDPHLCAEVDDWGIKRLTRLTSLARLNLDSRLFSDGGMEWVGQLTSLVALDLFGAKLTDTSCVHLRWVGVGDTSRWVMWVVGDTRRWVVRVV